MKKNADESTQANTSTIKILLYVLLPKPYKYGVCHSVWCVTCDMSQTHMYRTMESVFALYGHVKRRL